MMEGQPRKHGDPVTAWDREAHALTARHSGFQTRIEATAADILRIRNTHNAQFAPKRDWDPVMPLPPAGLTLSQTGRELVAATAQLQARLNLDTGALYFTHGDIGFAQDLGVPVWRELSLEDTALASMPETELPPGAARMEVSLAKRMAPDEGYFGFGQRTGKLDRRHRRLTHWTQDQFPGQCRARDNLYQAHPVLLAVRPRLAWGLYLHSTWHSAFDVGDARDGVLSLCTLGGELDYYILAGPTPAAVVEQLTRLTGRPALPPLWALGYHQSRWSYGSDADVRAIAEEFRKRRIPLDAIHLDIDYMDAFRVFTWDRKRFPAPAETVASLHAQDIRAVTIIDPGVKKDLDAGYPVADSGVIGDHFVRRPDGELFSGWVWPGESLFPDFCRKATRRWWGNLHQGLADIGVDGIWCDMNEPAIGDANFGKKAMAEQPIPLAARQGEDGEAPHAETRNLYGTMMARATYEGLGRLRPQRRPWVLTRSGFVGVQRWAASWMGDNNSWWEHLEMSLPQLTSMGLSGSPHVGVDIGGFYGNCLGELFARWIELGTFYPFMRCDSHQRSRPQEPWAFGPEIETIAQRAIELRYRLLPYIYTLAHRAYRSGEPLLRPLLYDFPNATELQQIEDQVMFGPQLMVAPVYQPGVRRRLVELPPGTWYDWRTGRRADPGPLVADAPLGQIPVYVSGGSILTLGNVRQSTAEPLTELTLEVYPDAEAVGRWTLIEDDGKSYAYRDGQIAETDFELDPLARGAALRIAPRRGSFNSSPRTLSVLLHLPQAPARVKMDGKESDAWHWRADRGGVDIRLRDDGEPHRLETRRA